MAICQLTSALESGRFWTPSIVEHPAFQSFYDDLIQEGLASATGDMKDTSATGDVIAADHRGGLPWHYVLLAEDMLLEWQSKSARLTELLDYARHRPLADASSQGRLL